MEYELTIGKDRAVSLVQDNSIGKLIKPLSREIQLFDSYVAGTGYGDAEALGALKVDDIQGKDMAEMRAKIDTVREFSELDM